MLVLLGLAVFVLPFYGKLRQMVHLYYRRSLRRSFYHDGLDVNWSEARDVSLCPNMIVSATLVDYCRTFDPDQAPHFSEFFFTSKWMGGDRTGFIEAPDELKLSNAMAISGAATDAFLLTKMNAMWVRITLLGLFNLFMGDYIEFKSSIQKGRWCGRIQAFCVNIIFVTFFVLLFASTESGRTDNDVEELPEKRQVMFWTAWGMLLLLIVASFFATLKGLRWLLSSTIIRHLHMMMMHYHTSDEPPLRLFLNDGGLVECLGLISLLRRRCEFMLVTDATADFSLQLVCLRETMHLAEAERRCTFFDLSDPRRGAEPLLQEFAASRNTHLRIGVLYDSWADASNPLPPRHERKTGEIFFVRMRLLEAGRHVGSQRITEDEVRFRRAPTPTEESPVTRLFQEQLGGCCCDCCHARCNCGLMGRFPDIATGNQFLTPTQFVLLCRLGYELSAEAVDALGRSQELRKTSAEYSSSGDLLARAAEQPDAGSTSLPASSRVGNAAQRHRPTQEEPQGREYHDSDNDESFSPTFCGTVGLQSTAWASAAGEGVGLPDVEMTLAKPGVNL